jgi:competence protein ComEA
MQDHLLIRLHWEGGIGFRRIGRYHSFTSEEGMKGIICGLLLIGCIIGFSPVLTDAAEGVAPKANAAVAKINVNSANSKELQRLPDIGKITAERIIEYRTTVKPFATPEDLLKVKGIGAKTLDKLRDQITFK